MPALGYQLEKKTPGGSWEPVTNAPILGETATVPDLVEGQEYEFRVAAITDAGVGDYSLATGPIKAEKPKSKSFIITNNYNNITDINGKFLYTISSYFK